ncbi:MAG TPA: hypothetical protein VJ900_00780 [Patescibacteria group bacterium]|nr:hypothetical protein [Patescibacteria group bacterium]
MHFKASDEKRDKRALTILAIFLIIFIPIFIIVNNDGEVFPSKEILEQEKEEETINDKDFKKE